VARRTRSRHPRPHSRGLWRLVLELRLGRHVPHGHGIGDRLDQSLCGLQPGRLRTFQYIYPILVQYDKTNKKFAPFYAKSWEVDGRRQDVDVPPHAEREVERRQAAHVRDAAWTINTDIKYASGGAANYAGLIAHITRADAPDPNTLVVRYKQAPGTCSASSSSSSSCRSTSGASTSGNKGADLKTFANNPPVVGSGPSPWSSTRRTRSRCSRRTRTTGARSRRSTSSACGCSRTTTR
jgi:ABC-type transport system substrate-binding protein